MAVPNYSTTDNLNIARPGKRCLSAVAAVITIGKWSLPASQGPGWCLEYLDQQRKARSLI